MEGAARPSSRDRQGRREYTDVLLGGGGSGLRTGVLDDLGNSDGIVILVERIVADHRGLTLLDDDAGDLTSTETSGIRGAERGKGRNTYSGALAILMLGSSCFSMVEFLLI